MTGPRGGRWAGTSQPSHLEAPRAALGWVTGAVLSRRLRRGRQWGISWPWMGSLPWPRTPGNELWKPGISRRFGRYVKQSPTGRLSVNASVLHEEERLDG